MSACAAAKFPAVPEWEPCLGDSGQSGPVEQTGTCKRWLFQKGYGFIAVDDLGGDTEVFVHKSALLTASYPLLVPGQRVAFRTKQDAGGRLAASEVHTPGSETLLKMPRKRRARRARQTTEVTVGVNPLASSPDKAEREGGAGAARAIQPQPGKGVPPRESDARNQAGTPAPAAKPDGAEAEAKAKTGAETEAEAKAKAGAEAETESEMETKRHEAEPEPDGSEGDFVEVPQVVDER